MTRAGLLRTARGCTSFGTARAAPARRRLVVEVAQLAMVQELVVAVRPLRQLAPIDIAAHRCKGCELCIGICPKHVLELDRSAVNVLGHNPVHLTDAGACTSCALCARICPDAVFTVYAPPRPDRGAGR